MNSVVTAFLLATCLLQTPPPSVDGQPPKTGDTKPPPAEQKKTNPPVEYKLDKGSASSLAKALEKMYTELRKEHTPPTTLEDMLSHALKFNPDILVAEAKVREKEAEVNRVRQKVVARITSLRLEIAGTAVVLRETKKRLQSLMRLRATTGGAVSDVDIGDAEVSVAKYNGELLELEQEWPYLLGKSTKDFLKPSTESTTPIATLTDFALKNNPDILVMETSVRHAEAELNRVRQQVLGKITILRGNIEATRSILRETQKRLNTLMRLKSSGTNPVSDTDIGDAEVSVAKYDAELKMKEAELTAVVGRKSVSSWRADWPSILKTYTVNGDAEEVTNTLQAIMTADPKLRVTAIGVNQVMVYAPVDIQELVAKYLVDRRNSKRTDGPEPAAPTPKLPYPDQLQGLGCRGQC